MILLALKKVKRILWALLTSGKTIISEFIFRSMIWFLLLREINVVSGNHETPTNQYYGQKITKDLLRPSRLNGWEEPEPNVIPIGSNDYEDITSEFYVSMKSFAENKCLQYVDYQSSKFLKLVFNLVFKPNGASPFTLVSLAVQHMTVHQSMVHQSMVHQFMVHQSMVGEKSLIHKAVGNLRFRKIFGR